MALSFVSPSTVQRSREAFRLRAALLVLLSGAELDPSERDEIATASLAAWRLVLVAECCALAVGAALRASGLHELLPPEARAELDAAELRETQRVVAARAVLRRVDEIAQRAGATVVVVKGGVAAVEPGRRPVDLGDVDLLVGRADAPVLWEALRSAGWTPKTEGLSPYDPEASARNHFAPLLPPGVGLPIELHHNLDYGGASTTIGPEDTLAIGGCRALRRLRAPLSLETSLRHTVVKHPFRRGHLRDLALFADEVRRDEPVDFREVERSLASDAYAPELIDMLRQVEAMCARDRPLDSRATRRFVAWKYASVLGANWAFREWIPGWSSVGYVTLERPGIRRVEYRHLLSYAFRAVPADSPFRRSAVGRRLSLASRGALWAVRVCYRVGLTLLLALSGWYLRRSVAAMIDSGPGAKSGLRRDHAGTG